MSTRLRSGAAFGAVGERLVVHLRELGAWRAEFRPAETLRLHERHQLQVGNALLRGDGSRTLYGPHESGRCAAADCLPGRGRHLSFRLVGDRRLLLPVQSDAAGELLARVFRVSAARLDTGVALVGCREPAGTARAARAMGRTAARRAAVARAAARVDRLHSARRHCQRCGRLAGRTSQLGLGRAVRAERCASLLLNDTPALRQVGH